MMRLVVVIMNFIFLSSFSTPSINKPGGWNDKDIPSEVSSANDGVINKMKSGDVEMLGVDKANVEQNAKSLDQIHDLDYAGRNKQMSEGEMLSSVLIDQSQPGMKAHLVDANNIAESTDQLLKNLVQGLKQSNDIDCKEYEGYRDLENSYHARKVTRQENHIANEPFFCEHLRNKYDCKDDLEIHCLQFSSRREDVRITGANFKYQVVDGVMVMRHDYKPTVQHEEKIEDKWLSGGAIGYKAFLTTYKLAEVDLTVSFDVRINPESFLEFALETLSYTGFVLVKLNDKVAFAAPYGGNDLRSLGYYNKVKIKTTGFAFLTTRDYYDAYPVISTGNQTYNLGEGGNSKPKDVGSVDLRPYLREGINTLTIKGISANDGYVTARLKSYERLCLKWSEDKWNETCTLKNN